MTDAGYPSTIPTPPGAPGAGAERSGCDKLLVGCGLGCGLLVLTFGVMFVFAGLWATRPGTQHETTSVVSPDGVAVMKLRDIGEDQGTQEFLTNVLQTFNEANRKAKRENLPENLRWLADLQGGSASPAGFNMFLPKDLTVSVEPRDPAELAAMTGPDEDDELAFVAAVNFRSFVRPIRMLITWAVEQEAQGEIRHHGDHDLLPMGESQWVTFVDGTFVMSNSYAALEASLDRLDRGTIERSWSGEVPVGDWDFFGVLSEGADVMQVVFDKVRRKNAEKAAEQAGSLEAPEVTIQPEVPGELVQELERRVSSPTDVVEQLAFGIDLESADALQAELLYTLADDAAAVRYGAYLAEEMEQLRIRGEGEGLTVETSVAVDANQVTAHVAVTGMEDKVAEIAEGLSTLNERQVQEVVEEVVRSVEESTKEPATEEPDTEESNRP